MMKLSAYGVSEFLRLVQHVKWADMVCLATETRDLMGDPQDWDLPYKPAKWKVVPQLPETAKMEFFRTYLILMKETGRL